MFADVLLKRVRKHRRINYDPYFCYFYLPLNFALIYWPFPIAFPYQPSVNKELQDRWRESYGPELWTLFHVMLVIILAFIVYWCARFSYRPNRFIWLPLFLACISLIIYWM